MPREATATGGFVVNAAGSKRDMEGNQGKPRDTEDILGSEAEDAAEELLACSTLHVSLYSLIGILPTGCYMLFDVVCIVIATCILCFLSSAF